jgi:hypothetical protein
MSLNPKVFQKFSSKCSKKWQVDFKNLKGGQKKKKKKPLNETSRGYQKPPEHCLILKAHIHVKHLHLEPPIFFKLKKKWKSQNYRDVKKITLYIGKGSITWWNSTITYVII